jgi:hypothetical protein
MDILQLQARPHLQWFLPSSDHQQADILSLLCTLSFPFLVRNNTSDRVDDMKKLSACTNVVGTDAKRPMEHLTI